MSLARRAAGFRCVLLLGLIGGLTTLPLALVAANEQEGEPDAGSAAPGDSEPTEDESQSASEPSSEEPQSPESDGNTSEPDATETGEKSTRIQNPVADRAEDAGDSATESPRPPEPAPDGALKIDAATFKGVQPGRSTRDDLNKSWGEPTDVRNVDGVSLQTYKVESFERVRATVSDDVVTSIVIYLDRPLSVPALAKQLGLAELEPVEVTDDRGQLMGQAFPERGVLFGFAPKAQQPTVAQILLEPIDPQPFVARAESRLQVAYTRSLADLDYALSLDDQMAKAHFLRGRVLMLMGRMDEAFGAAQQAASLEPAEVQYRLLNVELLKATGDTTGAHKTVQHMIDNERMPPLEKAQAIRLLGDCLASPPYHDYARATELHTQAIKLAEPLMSDDRVSLRRSAKELLLDTNLAVAHDVGWGSWQQKETVVPKWLHRARSIAEEMIANERGDDELLLRVYEEALEALAGLQRPIDPTSWVESALRVGKKLIDGTDDPARRQVLEWRLGTALIHATELETNRGRIDNALAYGDVATMYLMSGAPSAEKLPGRDYLIGRHYYALGNIHAVKRGDHKTAINWYSKATPLLEKPVPAGLVGGARQGDTFVGMAVSYWEIGDRKEALRLTTQGTQLLERAVEEGGTARTALAVPYGNLSSMHQELGNATEAKRYAEMASSCEAAERK